MKNSIIDDLKVTCPFPELLKEDEHSTDLIPQYSRKIVHIRADYDGRKWWNTIHPAHDELATPEIRCEVDAVYAAIVSEDAFADLTRLTAFCTAHPLARTNETAGDEFDFYYEGELCLYWLRCITRFKDYNLYLHAFLKSDAAYEPYFAFLDDLRESGKTNMYGAVPYLMRAFPALTEACAKMLLSRWMYRHEGR
ncbi:MAG: hypothetical protein PHY23_00370 [Oscillospiraceae bacterium]|nr:hypothetical protein [Oscillospiraceae bacterium]